MSTEERLIEAAEFTVAQARDEAIARIREGLAEEGEDDCIDCGRPIGEKRKAALPSAERCIGCQTSHERQMRRGS